MACSVPRVNVLTGSVGAEYMHRALVDPEQVGIEGQGLDVNIEQVTGQVPFDVDKAVFPALDEELQVAPVFPVFLDDPAEVGVHPPVALGAVNERAHGETVLVPEFRDLGRPVLILLVAPGDGGIVG